NLAAHEGDRVTRGQFLLQIDQNRAAAEAAGSSAALRASMSDLDSVKATMKRAEFDFERARRNYEAHIASEADFQKARSALDTARADFESRQSHVEQTRAGLNASRDTLSKTTVRAPIDGVVTTLRVKAGEVTVIGTMNNPGTQLMTISDMASVQAVLMGDETEAGKLKTEEGVYALRNGKAAFVPVRTGLSGELKVEVLTGLTPGEEVITGPFKALRQIKDGDRVKRMSEEERKAAEAEGAGSS